MCCRLTDDMHIRFGRVEGMSTRKGEVVFLKDILEEAQHRMLETMNQKDSKWRIHHSLVTFEQTSWEVRIE